MKGNKIYINIWKVVLFFFICFSNVNADLCDISKNCNSCQNCGKGTKNYQSCSYYNIYCYSLNGFWTTDTYSEYYKNEYIEYFEKDNEIKSFCGQIQFSLDNQQNITIFDSQEKIFPNNKKMHCHYTITTNGESNSLLEFIMSKNERVNEERHLQFQISNIFKYNSEKEEPVSYSYTKIKSSPRQYDLTEVKKIDIFIDFLESGYNQPEEIFQIKISFKEDKKSDALSIMGGILGGIVVLGILAAVAYCCCCQEKTYIVKEKSCQII